MPIGFGRVDDGLALSIDETDGDDVDGAAAVLDREQAETFGEGLRVVADADQDRDRAIIMAEDLAAVREEEDDTELVRITIGDYSYPVDLQTAREIADYFEGVETADAALAAGGDGL